MQKQRIKKLLSALYILLTIGIVVGIYFSDSQLQDIGTAIQQINSFWLIVAFLGIVFFWFFETSSIHYLASFVRLKLSWITSLKLSLIGQFYGALTPCQSGAQPSQVVYMSKKNIPVAKSTPMMVSKFLLWQIVEGLVATISIPYCWTRIVSVHSGLVVLALMGYFFNSMAIIGGILMMVNKKVVAAICRFISKVGHKLHLIRNSEKWMDDAKHFLDTYYESMKLILSDVKKAIISILLVLAQLVSLFIITYFIYLGCTGETFSFQKMLDIFLMQSVLTISVTFIPLPGANGTSEGGFYLLFSQFFPNNMMFIGMIIWRFITYYLNLIAGLIAILSDTVFSVGRHARKHLTKRTDYDNESQGVI